MTTGSFQNKTVVSVFGFAARRYGAGEIFARELSVQLGQRGWHSVLCFLEPPTEAMRKFFDLPNVSIEVVEDCWQLSGKATYVCTKSCASTAPEFCTSTTPVFSAPIRGWQN